MLKEPRPRCAKEASRMCSGSLTVEICSELSKSVDPDEAIYIHTHVLMYIYIYTYIYISVEKSPMLQLSWTGLAVVGGLATAAP